MATESDLKDAAREIGCIPPKVQDAGCHQEDQFPIAREVLQIPVEILNGNHKIDSDLNAYNHEHHASLHHHDPGHPDQAAPATRLADSPANQDEASQDSNSTEFLSPTSFEEGRILRKARKRQSSEVTTSCPVCGLTLRPGEVNSHFSLEIDRLNKINRGRKSYSKDTGHGKKTVVPSSSSCISEDGETLQLYPGNRYETYLRIKASRMSRLSGHGKAKKKKNETACPVCDRMISGTSDELNQHVEQCLSNREEQDVDIEGDGEYEEYEWAGQTRIRATTMLDGGGLAGVGMKSASKATDEEEDMDLNVDGDEETEFGTSQYSEADIIPCTSEEPEEDKERKALRRAFLKAKGEKVPSHNKKLPGDRRRWEEPGKSASPHPSSSSHPPSSDTDSDGDQESEAQYRQRTEEIISALRTKLKEQQELLAKTDHPKCLICMESYHKPLVSVHCWHVHCEECWLRTLGAKKLCPQCNTITSATDLRRVFL